MSYTPQNWVNKQTGAGATPLSAGRLNYMENGIAAAASAADAANTAASNANTAAGAAQTTANNAQTTANAAIPATQKAAANGVASLDGTGNVPAGQLGNVVGPLARYKTSTWTVPGTAAANAAPDPDLQIASLATGTYLLTGVLFAMSSTTTTYSALITLGGTATYGTGSRLVANSGSSNVPYSAAPGGWPSGATVTAISNSYTPEGNILAGFVVVTTAGSVTLPMYCSINNVVVIRPGSWVTLTKVA